MKRFQIAAQQSSVPATRAIPDELTLEPVRPSPSYHIPDAGPDFNNSPISPRTSNLGVSSGGTTAGKLIAIAAFGALILAIALGAWWMNHDNSQNSANPAASIPSEIVKSSGTIENQKPAPATVPHSSASPTASVTSVLVTKPNNSAAPKERQLRLTAITERMLKTCSFTINQEDVWIEKVVAEERVDFPGFNTPAQSQAEFQRRQQSVFAGILAKKNAQGTGVKQTENQRAEPRGNQQNRNRNSSSARLRA